MQKYLLCVQLVRFSEKLARHVLNKAAFNKQRATSCQTDNNVQLMQAVQQDLCLLQSIVQSHAEEQKATFAGIVYTKASDYASFILQAALSMYQSLVHTWLAAQGSKQWEQQHM